MNLRGIAPPIEPMAIQKLILVATVTAGAFLRLYALQSKSLWTDEAWSLYFARLDLSQILQLRDNNPPLDNVLLHFWVYLSGESEFALRFLSVMFGILSVVLIYKVGCLIFSRDVGLVSSILLAVSSFHVQYSQEARHYSLVALLCLLSVYFFIKLLKTNGRTSRVALGYILWSALLLYSFPLAPLIIVIQNVYVIILVRRDVNRAAGISLSMWLSSQLALLALFAPWLAIFVGQVMKVEAGFWVPKPTLTSLVDTLIAYSSGSRYLAALFVLLVIMSSMQLRNAAGKIDWKSLSSFLKSWSSIIHFPNSGAIGFLVMWLITPILIPFAISQFSSPIYWPKYTIPASLAFFILAARGIENTNQNAPRVLITMVVVVLSLKSLGGYYLSPGEEQWRDAANYVEANAKRGDVLVFHWADGAFNYYSKREDLVKIVFPEGTLGVVNEDNAKTLDPLLSNYSRVWLILSHSRDPSNLIYDTLDRSRDLADSRDWLGIKTYLFIKRDPQRSELYQFHSRIGEAPLGALSVWTGDGTLQ